MGSGFPSIFFVLFSLCN